MFPLENKTLAMNLIYYVAAAINNIKRPELIMPKYAKSFLSVFLLAFSILIGFLPFAYARRRLHHALTPLLQPEGRGATLLVFWTALGILCDVLMVGQLLLARSPDPNPLINASPLSWLGPVWVRGRAFLVLGSGVIGLARLVGGLRQR